MSNLLKAIAITVIGLIAMIFLILTIESASAQEAGGTTITLAPLIEAVGPIIAQIAITLVTALVGWLSYKVNQYLGLNIEARHREALQSALMNGVWKGLHFIEDRGAGIGIDVKSEILAEGIRYVQRSVPDAIQYFGLTEDRLRELLEAKLPTIDQGVDDG